MALFNRQPATVAESGFDAPTTVLDDIAGDYALDAAHTRLGFSARHAMVTTVRGVFKDFAGTARLETADPAGSWVKIAIQAASVDTGSTDRDGHLTSGDFFDAETHPEITFASKGDRGRRRRDLPRHGRPYPSRCHQGALSRRGPGHRHRPLG